MKLSEFVTYPLAHRMVSYEYLLELLARAEAQPAPLPIPVAARKGRPRKIQG